METGILAKVFALVMALLIILFCVATGQIAFAASMVIVALNIVEKL